MDLAVRRQLPVVGEDEGVQRAGRVLGHLEHPGEPGGPGAGAQLAEPGGERPVQRFGVRREVGAGLAEVAGERLGQHHQVGSVGEGSELVEDGTVLGRIESRRALHEAHPELVLGLGMGEVSHPPSLPVPPVTQAVAQAVAHGPGWCQTADVGGRGTAELGGIVLTGGSAVRFQGADKASIEIAGVTLLEHALGALSEVPDVVVVGDEVMTSRPVGFVREDPHGGGPAAGVLAGLSAFPGLPRLVVVLAVDMPLVTTATVNRLMLSADEDGALLVDEDGRRQYLCAIYRTEALLTAAPPLEEQHGLPMRKLVSGLRLGRGPGGVVGGPGCGHLGGPDRAEGAARRLIRRTPEKTIGIRVASPRAPFKTGDREPARLDRRAVRRARHRGRGGRGTHPRPRQGCRPQVERPAAPISTFLLGYAAAGFDGKPAEVERLAALAVGARGPLGQVARGARARARRRRGRGRARGRGLTHEARRGYPEPS